MNTSPSDSEPETVLCINCCELRPITDFRLRERGKEARVTQCRKCHADYERRRMQRKRAKAQGRQMQALATAIRSGGTAQRLETLLKISAAASGGYRNLLQNWYQTIQEDVTSRKRPIQLVRFYRTVLQGMLNSGKNSE